MVTVEYACRAILADTGFHYISGIFETDDIYIFGVIYDDGSPPYIGSCTVDKKTGKCGGMSFGEYCEITDKKEIKVPNEFRCPNYKHYDD